jgi:hypothetical protein
MLRARGCTHTAFTTAMPSASVVRQPTDTRCAQHEENMVACSIKQLYWGGQAATAGYGSEPLWLTTSHRTSHQSAILHYCQSPAAHSCCTLFKGNAMHIRQSTHVRLDTRPFMQRGTLCSAVASSGHPAGQYITSSIRCCTTNHQSYMLQAREVPPIIVELPTSPDSRNQHRTLLAYTALRMLPWAAWQFPQRGCGAFCVLCLASRATKAPHRHIADVRIAVHHSVNSRTFLQGKALDPLPSCVPAAA